MSVSKVCSLTAGLIDDEAFDSERYHSDGEQHCKKRGKSIDAKMVKYDPFGKRVD